MNYKNLIAIAISSVLSATAVANLEVNVTKEPSSQSQVKLAPIPDDKMNQNQNQYFDDDDDDDDDVPDAQLLSQIQDLIKGSYSQYFIKVHVMDGDVILDGAIGSEADKRALIDKIKAIRGVDDVKDNLVISSPAMEK